MTTQDPLALTCLKAMKVDASSERIALYAASIIVHAHAAARQCPAAHHEALRIVDLTRRLYAVMPSRQVVAGFVDEFLTETCAGDRNGARSARARDRLVEKLWRHFQHGTDRPDSGGRL